MRQVIRRAFPYLAVLLAGAAVAYAVTFGQIERADYTFNNQTEIKTLDPALVTGAPEGRIIRAVFEGLMRPNAKDLQPEPGMAERFEVSEDGRTYTFYIRDNAQWTNGEPVTAHDFEYSLRRFLDPMTAAEYAYQAWYVVNAKKYSLGAMGIRPGDAVEVELNKQPSGALPFARGIVLRGKLTAIEQGGESVDASMLDDLAKKSEADELTDDEKQQQLDWVFVVEIDGKTRRFERNEEAAEGLEPCKQVLLDFNEVGIKALDEKRFQTTLVNPTPYWLQLMSFYPLNPVNKTCVETYGTPAWTYTENIVSNGAFEVAFRRIRDRTRLVKSHTYWDRENVRLNVVDALSIENLTTAVNMFLTGEVDRIVEVPPTVMRILRKQKRNDLNPSAFFGCYFYRLNTNHAPLEDERVRMALNLALNREEIITTATAAGEKAARSLVPPGADNYQRQLCAPYHPERAKQLLAEAGYPDGEGFPRMSILYNTHENHRVIAEIIRKQWQQNLGIRVTTRNQEWGTYLNSQRQLDYDICRAAWIGDYFDAYTFLDMFVTGGEQNNTGWSNARYDQLLVTSKKELDVDKRREILEEAERILMKEMPLIPIYYYRSKNMVKPYVRGFYNTLRDEHPLRAIWIDRDNTEPNEFMRFSQ